MKEKESLSPTKPVKEIYREIKGEQEVYHDLFELSIEQVTKNLGYDTQQPIYRQYPHKHFYHSYDSNGRPQSHSTFSAGHCHKIEMSEKDGKLEISVGPALSKAGGKFVSYIIEDTAIKLAKSKGEESTVKLHTHEGHYVVSEVFKIRKKNSEAMKHTKILKGPDGSVTVQ